MDVIKMQKPYVSAGPKNCLCEEKKDEGDLKNLSLHLLILRETLLASQNKSLPVTNARRPTKLLPPTAAILSYETGHF